MPVTFQHHVLPNGLTLIAEVNPDAHTAAVGFFVKAGTRDEALSVMGVSHFLEHMMFKGTARRSADDVNREFDEIGANYNAYTSHEQTVYYAHVLPEYLVRAVDLLGDMLRPALRQEDFDMEKNVILEEISMYDDRPTWRMQDALMEDHFGTHPLGYRVLGTEASIQALTADQMRTYFDHRYSPDNIVVSAAGNLDFDALVAQVTALAGDWPSTGASRDYATPTIAGVDRTLEDAKVSRHYMGLMCPAPSAQDELRYAAKILADILGDAEGSRLYWALVDPGLADEADFSFVPYDQTGAYLGYASCDPDRASQVQAVWQKTLNDLPGSITDDELDRAKNKLATGATLQGERPDGRMRSMGSQWTYQGQYWPLDEELARLTAVTCADLATILEQYPLTRQTLLRLTPASP